jgi:vacuolar-type H+-ATPase subunit C/Vma6
MSAEEAFRALQESGFGGGVTAESVYAYEKLVAGEERALDAFIAEYAPSGLERSYFLAPRDFHNAKALIKATSLGESTEKLLAPEGEIPVAVIEKAVSEGDFSELGEKNEILKGVCEEAYFAVQAGEKSGAQIGESFEKAKYAYLLKRCKSSGTLKKLLRMKIDMQNVLIAFRTKQAEEFEEKFIAGGFVKLAQYSVLFESDKENAGKLFAEGKYRGFVEKCVSAQAKGLPCVDAEREFSSFEREFFYEKRYELQRNLPFVYYVFRRRAEIANVRIVFACLLAGVSEGEIKRRLRSA